MGAGLKVDTNMGVEGGSIVLYSSSDIKDFERVLPKYVDKETRAPIKQAQNDARNEHKYTSRTGNLRDSTFITGERGDSRVVSRIEGYIDSSAEYGKYVTRGGKNRPRDPFIENAMKKNEKNISDGIDRGVEKALDKIGEKPRSFKKVI